MIALADQFQMVCDEHHDGRVRIVRRHYISRAQVALLSYVTKNTEIALTQTIGLVLVPHAYLVAGRGTGPFRFCLKKNDDSPDNQVARLLACQRSRTRRRSGFGRGGVNRPRFAQGVQHSRSRVYR